MKHLTETKPILFWFAEVEGEIVSTFHLIIEDELEVVKPGVADHMMTKAIEKNYSIFCFN